MAPYRRPNKLQLHDSRSPRSLTLSGTSGSPTNRNARASGGIPPCGKFSPSPWAPRSWCAYPCY